MSPYEYIKQLIITAKYAPGEVFDESKIAKELNCSRTPVREAVLKLCEEGYLTIIPRKGTLVSSISMTDIQDVYDFRMVLECECLKNITSTNIEILNKWKEYYTNLLSNIVNEDNTQEDEDKQFHLDLISFKNNKLMTHELEKLMDKSSRIRYLSNIKNKGRYTESINEHLDIINALLNNDYLLSSKMMEKHLKKSLEGYNF